jgi:dihydrofolate reductase
MQTEDIKVNNVAKNEAETALVLEKPRLIRMVVAFAHGGVIGYNGAMPWHLRDDLKLFKAATVGHPVVMGRKTFEVLGRALPGRVNIVVSGKGKEGVSQADTATWVSSLSQGLAVAAEHDGAQCAIIGGGQIYAQAMPFATQLHYSEIDARVEGDTFFPLPDMNEWVLEREQAFEAGGGNDYAFIWRELTKKA